MTTIRRHNLKALTVLSLGLVGFATAPSSPTAVETNACYQTCGEAIMEMIPFCPIEYIACQMCGLEWTWRAVCWVE